MHTAQGWTTGNGMGEAWVGSSNSAEQNKTKQKAVSHSGENRRIIRKGGKIIINHLTQLGGNDAHFGVISFRVVILGRLLSFHKVIHSKKKLLNPQKHQ